MTNGEQISAIAAEVGSIDMLEVLASPGLMERKALLHPHVAGELGRLYYWNPTPSEAHRLVNARLEQAEQYDDNARVQTAFRRLNERYIAHQAYEPLNNGSVRPRPDGNTRTAVKDFVQHELVVAGMVHGLFSGSQTIESFGRWLGDQHIGRRDALEVIASAHEKIDYSPANKKAGALRWQIRRLWLQTMMQPLHLPGSAAASETEARIPDEAPVKSGLAEILRNEPPATLRQRFRLAAVAFGYGHNPPTEMVEDSRKRTFGNARLAAALFKAAWAQLGLTPAEVIALTKQDVSGKVAQRLSGELKEGV